MKRLIAVAVLTVACAEDLPGIVPPLNQLYYPTGIVHLPGPTETIAVCNSNFDQRYNAGSILTIKVDAIFNNTELFVDAIPAPPEGEPAQGVRVQNFCGDLSAMPLGTGGDYRLFSAIRGRNRLSMVEVNNGIPKCSTANTEPALGTDCTLAYSVRTNFGDPFSVAVGFTGTATIVAVGHLLTAQAEDDDLVTGIAYTDAALFDNRIAAEAAGTNPDEIGGARLDRFDNISGTNALIFVPKDVIGSPFGTFIAGGRRVNVTDTRTQAALVGFDVVLDPSGFALSNGFGLNVQDLAGVEEVRGIALSKTAPRMYIAVRFEGAAGTINSGVGVVAIEDHALRMVSVFEVGDELGIPTLLEPTINGRQLRVLYVPDIRDDAIWVVDVTSDQPALLAKIDGRAQKTLPDGRVIEAHMLDAPTKIVFVEGTTKTLGMVTNFANSTLAVIDATNPLAPVEEVIARFGQALTPDGKNEGDE